MDKYSTRGTALLLAGVLTFSTVGGGLVYASRPKEVTVTIDEQTIELYTSQATVEEALLEAGYTEENLENALTSIDLESAIEDQMEVDITTEKDVELIIGGESQVVSTHVDTVGALLDENEVVFDEDDTISPARGAKIVDGSTVTVDYYETTTSIETIALPYQEVVEETADLYYDQTELSQEGVEGSKEVETATTTKNGQIITTEVIRDEVMVEPVNQITLQGTAAYPEPEPEPEPVVEESYNDYYEESYDDYYEEETTTYTQSYSSAMYSIDDFEWMGIINWDGKTYSYYSERVLPGPGLNIPGRHTSGGFVRDGEGYIVLASDYYAKGTVISTPFGSAGKVYDAFGTGQPAHRFDVYTR